MKMNLHCFANLIPIMILAYSMFLSKSFYENESSLFCESYPDNDSRAFLE